jgi:hypothetical protein
MAQKSASTRWKRPPENHPIKAPTLDVLVSLAHALELPLRELVDFVKPAVTPWSKP